MSEEIETNLANAQPNQTWKDEQGGYWLVMQTTDMKPVEVHFSRSPPNNNNATVIKRSIETKGWQLVGLAK